MARKNQVKIDATVGLYNQGYKVDEVASFLGIGVSTAYAYLTKRVHLRTTPKWSKFRATARAKNLAIMQLAKLNGEI